MQEFWNERYRQNDYAYGTTPNVWFKTVIDTLPPGKLLVPGAGEGRDAVYAATKGWEVTAFDFSEAAKIKAEKLAALFDVRIHFQVADATAYEDVQQYDMVALIFFHLPPESRKNVHRKMMQLLKPGGWLVLEAFTPAQLQYTSGGPSRADMLYTPQMLEDDFQGMDMLENKTLETELEEGLYHRGKAAVVRFLAKSRLPR